MNSNHNSPTFQWELSRLSNTVEIQDVLNLSHFGFCCYVEQYIPRLLEIMLRDNHPSPDDIDHRLSPGENVDRRSDQEFLSYATSYPSPGKANDKLSPVAGIARRTLGISLLLVVVVLWTTSNFLASVRTVFLPITVINSVLTSFDALT